MLLPGIELGIISNASATSCFYSDAKKFILACISSPQHIASIVIYRYCRIFFS